MKLVKFREHFKSELIDQFPETEIQSFFTIIIEEYLNLQRIDLVTRPNFDISEEKLQLLSEILKRLKNHEPIQYILGKTEFYGLPFYVNHDVLIPRPETEELVEWVIAEVQKLKSDKDINTLSILDIGTGSGCIPISIKKNTSLTELSGLDISNNAIEIAKKNSELNSSDVQFILKDILSTSSLDKNYDMIISNPPYVRELEKEEMNKNVLDHEPELALFVSDDDPLLFYRKIAILAKNNLTKNGSLFFEINEYLGEEMIDLLTDLGFTSIELRKDIFGKDRMIKTSF